MANPPVPHTPPRFEPGDDQLAGVRALARLMDTAVVIPGTNFRVGLDVVVGLIPVIGDLIGAAVSTYILLVAVRAGVPRPVIARMLANIGTDAVLGAVPVVGDVADAAWRANAKNARLLEQAVTDPRRARRASFWVMAGVVAAVLLMVGGGIAVTVWVVRSLT